MIEDSRHKVTRREFVGMTTVGGLMLLKPDLVRGTAANSAVRLGILGCGGRGTAVGSGFVRHTNVRVVALADLFADQLENARKQFDELQKSKGYSPIDASQLFRGPKAYQQIAASKEVDAVLITSPPYFHPQHLEAVVDAGKHVYCEKPVAVDVPGAKRVIRIGEKAQGKLSLDVGFQIRTAPPFLELTQRIHQAALGKIACGQAYYYSGAIRRPEWPNASPEEKRLRNWVWDRALSGDIIVEQNVHVIDVCNWVLQGHPIKASGAGGRKVRTDPGDCFDHFNVTFTYPEDIHVTFSSVQFAKGWWDVGVRFFGSKGVSEAHYEWPVRVTGDEPWDWQKSPGAKEQKPGEFSATGAFKGALDEADSEKQKSFIESITSGKFHNQAAHGADSALSAMLGRMAAYTGNVVTWDKLLKSKEVSDPRIDLNKLA